LEQSRSYLKNLNATFMVVSSMCEMAELGALGPDRKRMHEGFMVSVHDKSPYPGFWGHKSDTVKEIAQIPNCHLLNWLESPRGPEYGKHLWKRAGTVLLA
jgi:hypothetical protein